MRTSHAKATLVVRCAHDMRHAGMHCDALRYIMARRTEKKDTKTVRCTNDEEEMGSGGEGHRDGNRL